MDEKGLEGLKGRTVRVEEKDDAPGHRTHNHSMHIRGPDEPRGDYLPVLAKGADLRGGKTDPASYCVSDGDPYLLHGHWIHRHFLFSPLSR